MTKLLQVCNETTGFFFVQLNDGPRTYIDGKKTIDIVGWKRNDNVKIGWLNGYNEPNFMINNQQSLPGKFIIEVPYKMPKVRFDQAIDNDEEEEKDYTEQQMLAVSKVFECDCARTKCPCMTPDNYKQHCGSLIRQGVLNESQLDKILEELFSI